MQTIILHNKKEYQINLAKPLDISMPLRGNVTNVNAWYVDHPKITPHKDGDFVGSIEHGASTNFNDIWFNPHAHGTHTECVGHITRDFVSINQTLDQFFFLSELITIAPGKKGADFIITKQQLQHALGDSRPEALVIRTLPNTNSKMARQYAHTNPPYLLEEATQFLVEVGVDHLLIDLPSVDKEKDHGAVLAHKAFWNVNGTIRYEATITEFIYVPNSVADGSYFLNLQVAPFENDASPSRPVLYKIKY